MSSVFLRNLRVPVQIYYLSTLISFDSPLLGSIQVHVISPVSELHGRLCEISLPS